MRHLIFMIAALLCITSGSARAQGPGIVLKAGTLGAGLDIGWGFSESFGTRLSISGYSDDDTFTESNVDYTAEVDLSTAGLLLDWHPMRGHFRMTAGAYLNNNEINATGRPTGGTYEINGKTYIASDIGSVNGLIEFDSISPYIGVGFGSMSRKGFKFTADFGVLYQKPDAILTVTCGVGLTPGECATLQSDAAAEQAQLNNELDDYRFYPVIAIGIGWVF